MQHHLAAQYELAWAVADLVAANGRHDFRAVDGIVNKIVSFCGLTVMFDDALPVSLNAPDMQLTLVRKSAPTPFAAHLNGPSFEMMHDMTSATYTLEFARGDLTTLQNWRDRLLAFMDATAVKKAA